MHSRYRVRASSVGFALVAACIATASAHQSQQATNGGERLAEIGPAPAFALLTQDRKRLALEDLRGKVVAVSFIYTACPDVCSLLTVKMVQAQKALGDAFGDDVYFISITMDPEVDTPEVLAGYARALGCDATGWSFLSGSEAEIRDVANQYGVVYRKQGPGSVDHNLMTSIIDREGVMRVQYMGYQFDPVEFTTDLQSLLHE